MEHFDPIVLGQHAARMVENMPLPSEDWHFVSFQAKKLATGVIYIDALEARKTDWNEHPSFVTAYAVDLKLLEQEASKAAHDHQEGQGRLPTRVQEGQEPRDVQVQEGSPAAGAAGDLLQAQAEVAICSVGSYGGCMEHSQPAGYCLDRMRGLMEKSLALHMDSLRQFEAYQQRLKDVRREIAGYAEQGYGTSRLPLRILDEAFPELRP